MAAILQDSFPVNNLTITLKNELIGLTLTLKDKPVVF